MAYVKAYITLQDLNGEEAEYQVGADVQQLPGGNGWAPSYEVGEPTFSAPGCELDQAWLAPDPQGGEAFPDGWSDAVEEAIVDAYLTCGDDYDDGLGLDPDEYNDKSEES